jgi:lipopolysaccharide/colanic/teichoic acid biosynthesis glycosyltransferase
METRMPILHREPSILPKDLFETQARSGRRPRVANRGRKPHGATEPPRVAWGLSHVHSRREIRLFRHTYELAKRMLDVSICLGVLILMLPVMGLCSLLIWLDDPGPILFRQWRTGLAGRRFRIYKFRTMKTNAEELKAKYAHLNESKWPDFKMANDPRVTRIGYWLRKASLDELPQLFNVLRGDMSLVGPRPTSFDVTTYALWYTERLEVLPGITGLAQVNGRADLDFDQRRRLDIAYIERRSFWFDLCILSRTNLIVFKQHGAY